MTQETSHQEMPIFMHLKELRQRVVASLLILVATTLLAFVFSEKIFAFLTMPLVSSMNAVNAVNAPAKLIFTAPHEFFVTRMYMSLYVGMILGFPFLAFHFYRFLTPGLYRHERKILFPFLFLSPVFFMVGAGLVFFVIAPLALDFFLAGEIHTTNMEIMLLPKVDSYLQFIITLTLATGLCFQLPVVLYFLCRVGILDLYQVKRARRYVIVGVFLVAALLTPPDVVSQIGLAVPTLLLFEGTLLLLKFEKRCPPKRGYSQKEEH